jgi:DcaP outer membrane protein
MLRFPQLTFFMLMLFQSSLMGQEDTAHKNSLTIFGQIMMDAGYDFKRVDPLWYDVLRPTKLLDENGNAFAPNGSWFMGVRQTNFGVKSEMKTSRGPLIAQFDFELFGTGDNAGQTAFRLRNAYAEWNHLLVGQTNSLFMDIDVFPNSIEYWGPSGMPFFRNIQIRYTPFSNSKHHFSMALERPGATADQGVYGEEFKYGGLLEGVKWRFPIPDVSMEYRKNTHWGYLELAGILRYIRYEDENRVLGQYDFSGSNWAWGFNLSTNVQISKKVIFRGSVTGGEGVQNYMDDADADIGVKRVYNNPKSPLTGKAIPMVGITAFMDFAWNDRLSSSIGYSGIRNKTLESQLQTSFESGDYALTNLLYYPVKNVMVGLELQWAARKNNDFAGDTDYNFPPAKGNSASDVKLQCSFRYVFGHTFQKP